MSKMWSKAVIPEAKVRVARLTAEILQRGSLEEMLTPPENAVDEIRIPTEEMMEKLRQLLRFIFTMDSCWAQLKATFENINELFNQEGSRVSSLLLHRLWYSSLMM